METFKVKMGSLSNLGHKAFNVIVANLISPLISDMTLDKINCNLQFTQLTVCELHDVPARGRFKIRH